MSNTDSVLFSLEVSLVVCLAVFALYGLLGLANDMLARHQAHRRWVAGARGRYESLRETFNWEVSLILGRDYDGEPGLNDDEQWTVQTCVYDLRSARG